MKKEGYLKLRHTFIIFIILAAAGCKMPFGSSISPESAKNSFSSEPLINSISSEPAINTVPSEPASDNNTSEPVINSVPVEPVIRIIPEAKEISVTDRILFEIKVDDVSNLSAASFYITFDTTLLKFAEAAEGTFLNRNSNDPTSFLFFNNTDKGRIMVGSSRMGQDSGISGSGLLMTVKFEAIAKGTADISFSNIYAKGNNGTKTGTIPMNFAGTRVCVK